MSGSLSNTPQPIEGAPQGLLGALLGLVRVAAVPFDRILAGMVGAGLCIEALCIFLGLTQAILDRHLVRLGLRTPNDKPFRRPGKRGWSVEDVQRLIAWRSAGVHPEVIGDSLSKPRRASTVRAKCRRVGLQAPPRKMLFRPDAVQLRELRAAVAASPEPLSPSEKCGRAAGPAVFDFAPPIRPTTGEAPKKPRAPRGLTRPQGQRELPLLGVADGANFETVASPPIAAVTKSANAAPPAQFPPAPTTCADVDFSDVTWIGRLTRPLTHEPAVWAVGMLMMGGLHYREAAELVGMSVAAFRTMRTRMRVPVEPIRKKLTNVFDREVADATRERNKYVIRKSIGTNSEKGGRRFFWVQKDDRSTWLPPDLRKRDRQIEGRSPLMSVVTRAVLDAEARLKAGLISPPPIRGCTWNQSARSQSLSPYSGHSEF